MMNKTTVAVVGAGAWGVWTAYLLQEQGYDVTLIDRWGAGNSSSGSGGETRIIRTVYGGDELYTQMAHHSFELWESYTSQWNVNLYHETGAIWMSKHKHPYISQSVGALGKLGYSLEELDIKDAATRFPQIDFNGINSIFYEPKCGYLEARNACQFVSKEFEAIGGTYLLDNIESVSGQSSIDYLSTSNNRQLESDYYVFACGPWVTQLFPDLRPYVYISRQEVYFFQDQGLKEFDRLPIWLEFTEDDMYYGIPDHFNRGFKVSYDSREIKFDPETEDRIVTNAVVDKMKSYVEMRFRNMRNTTLAEGRVCLYDNSLDGDFIIDKVPGFNNAIILGGTSGHGYKMAPAAAEMVTKYLLEDKPFEPRFSLSRLKSQQKRSTQFD